MEFSEFPRSLVSLVYKFLNFDELCVSSAVSTKHKECTGFVKSRIQSINLDIGPNQKRISRISALSTSPTRLRLITCSVGTGQLFHSITKLFASSSRDLAHVKIVDLDFGSPFQWGKGSVDVTSLLNGIILSCPNLRELLLKSVSNLKCWFEDGIWRHLALRCPDLEILHLDLKLWERVPVYDVVHIFKNCRKLRVFSVADTFVDFSVFLSELDRLCQSLECLLLRNCNIDDNGVKEICKACPGLKCMDLGFAHVTDEGIEHIATRLVDIQELGLFEVSRITDQSLEMLKKCKNLKVLDVENTFLSDECLDDFELDSVSRCRLGCLECHALWYSCAV